jgi:hypothetical protein
MRAVTLLFAIGLAGCLRAADYRCTSAADCGMQGTCQPGGHCSFADPSCASGQRFGELSGAAAGQCVGAGGDGGVADGAIDGSGDGSVPGCPNGYGAMSGGNAGHAYRKLAAADWQTQVNACAADGAKVYLAIPDDPGELNGIRGEGGDAWVGISDNATAGSYVTVLGAAATYLPWGNGEPNTALHCVEEVKMTHLATLSCSNSLFAMCECAP